MSKASIDDSAFEALEKDFQEVLQELMGDKSLEKFRVEYEKLHKALRKSHESEKRLMQKCRELNAEIVANSAKVSTALKLSQEDQATIASLKKVKYFDQNTFQNLQYEEFCWCSLEIRQKIHDVHMIFTKSTS